LAKILSQMLAFSPEHRATAASLLKNPIFDSVRDPKLEMRAASRVSVAVDLPESFDYSTMEGCGKVSSTASIINLIDKEIELAGVI